MSYLLLLNDILTAIETQQLCKFLVTDVKHYKYGNKFEENRKFVKDGFDIYLKHYPIGVIRDHWIKQRDLIVKEYINVIINPTNKFLTENLELAFEIIEEYKNEVKEKINKIKEKIKEKRKLINKTYYEKAMKKLQTGEPIKKILTEEEKIERKKIANKKFRDSQVKEVVTSVKPILSEEEKKECRKQANKKYYENKNKSNEEVVLG